MYTSLIPVPMVVVVVVVVLMSVIIDSMREAIIYIVLAAQENRFVLKKSYLSYFRTEYDF